VKKEIGGQRPWFVRTMILTRLELNFQQSGVGLRDDELSKASGVSDAVFCHKAGFLFVAKNKEGVLEAVRKTLGE